ncbi:hypothetical protein QVH35_11660 [Candidatus Nitrosotenuis chungbukensis]|uniref:hypothetical protein n=1 Tax=Candidatus Nitrosotenuis chungbukensis TaxID=1353246 RepID=UPI0012FEF188|nr:hypothetical protein [Candidatus Nitrosotenuis chungbukensis]WKT57922.1 hypothetical protein QVH35_11660 [Candidatus Nitrosotenuis chungbukensis]
MVWFQYKNKTIGLIRRKTIPKFLKKFQKDGMPDPDYFGAGMYANYVSEPPDLEIIAYEIFPTLKENNIPLSHIVTEAIRSFELYKHDDSDTIRLVIRSTLQDIQGYAKSLGLEYRDTGLKMLPILSESSSSNHHAYFFDFELANQFNFTSLEPLQEPIINKLIRAMNTSKNCGIVVQFVFTRSVKWNQIAKLTSSKLSRYLKSMEEGITKYVFTGIGYNFIPTVATKTFPRTKQLSSSIYQTGKKLEEIYHQKAQSVPITLSIRGIIVGNQNDFKAAAQNLDAVFSSIRIIGDSLEYFDYPDLDVAYKWLENNTITSKYAVEILEENANMWNNMNWGIGRDFVQFLCLAPDEFPIFVSLPTDPTLPISYRRQKLKGLNYDKMVFSLGSVL